MKKKKGVVISECIIRNISVSEKIKKGHFKNHFHYTADVYSPSKRNWKHHTMFMEKTKPKILKRLKEEYML